MPVQLAGGVCALFQPDAAASALAGDAAIVAFGLLAMFEHMLRPGVLCTQLSSKYYCIVRYKLPMHRFYLRS